MDIRFSERALGIEEGIFSGTEYKEGRTYKGRTHSL